MEGSVTLAYMGQHIEILTDFLIHGLLQLYPYLWQTLFLFSGCSLAQALPICKDIFRRVPCDTPS